MEPTLPLGSFVMVREGAYVSRPPEVGDIIVFHPPRDAVTEVCGAHHRASAVCPRPEKRKSTQEFVKRIVAGPGDVITMRSGHVYRNGHREADSYIRPCLPMDSTCDFPTPVKLPAGHWFVLGDNRGQSNDSRFWGPVPTAWIVGKVLGH
jgi:signal peptidase I